MGSQIHNLSNYVDLGLTFHHVDSALTSMMEGMLCKKLTRLALLLNDTGFHYEAKELSNLTHILETLINDKGSSATLNGEQYAEIHRAIAGAWNTIKKELPTRRAIIIDENNVIKSLYDLKHKFREAQEIAIIDDLIRCLESGAYRAAIVMRWNLHLNGLGIGFLSA